jgi:hypothetical protein
MLRTVAATRYVTPLREGGSKPAIVEADDLGLYVVKFRGAGQGPLALVSEILGGEIGRAFGLRVPELVLVDLDPTLGRTEPDQEIWDQLRASEGMNLGLDYLPGSLMFDAGATQSINPAEASDIVWFEAFITNVDRTARNPNLLWWHRQLYLIDHGAALFFHHDWQDPKQSAQSRFPAIRQHVLLPWASELQAAHERAMAKLNEEVLRAIIDAVPDAWLLPEPGAETPELKRQGYLNYFMERLQHASGFVEEAVRGHAQLV